MVALALQSARSQLQCSADRAQPTAMTALANMRAAEFKRLGDEVYVDHAGATLPSEKQLEDVFKVGQCMAD